MRDFFSLVYRELYSQSPSKRTMADEGKLQKMEVDYSTTVDEKIPECEKLTKVCFGYISKYILKRYHQNIYPNFHWLQVMIGIQCAGSSQLLLSPTSRLYGYILGVHFIVPVFNVLCSYLIILQSGKLNEAIDILLSLEKQTRTVSLFQAVAGTTRVSSYTKRGCLQIHCHFLAKPLPTPYLNLYGKQFLSLNVNNIVVCFYLL